MRYRFSKAIGLSAIAFSLAMSVAAWNAQAADETPAGQTQATQAPAAKQAETPSTAPATPANAAAANTATVSDKAKEAAALPVMAIGNEKAPVTIIEYSSLSCPHCAAFHKDVLPKLKTDYIEKGKVRYEVREFPLNEPALAGSVIARCLDPTRFFPFIELLFSHQADWAFKDDALAPLKTYAKQAGLPEEQFNKCLDDEALQKKILAVRDQGQKMGVNATPTLFVNGTKVKALTFEGLVEAMKPYLGS